MGGLLRARAMRPAFDDRIAMSATPRAQAVPRWPGGPAGPLEPPKARPRPSRRNPGSCPSASEPVIAVELEAPVGFGGPPDVEAGRQAEDRAAVELDRGDDEVRAADPECAPSRVVRSGMQVPAPCADGTGRAEHRRDQGERVDADVDQDADVVERCGCGVPGLDPAPVNLGVDGPDGPEPAAADDRRPRSAAPRRGTSMASIRGAGRASAASVHEFGASSERRASGFSL